MKKQIFAFMVIMSFAFVGCEDDSDTESIMVLDDLPSGIQAYVDEHFPEQSVSRAILDKDTPDSSYELLLNDLTKLEFNMENMIIEIDGQSKLPDSVIPVNILVYVSSNYPDNDITDWELENGYQQIQLDNKLEIEFNMEGEFLRLDK